MLICNFEIPLLILVQTQRLLPASIFAVVSLIGCFIFTKFYTPPARSKRVFQDVPFSVATILCIFALCFSVWFLWHIPVCQHVFNKYLCLVPGLPVAPSVLGNIFSHPRILHLAGNMACLFVYGISGKCLSQDDMLLILTLEVHEYVGRGNFVALYLAGGIFGSIASLYWFVLRGILHTSHMGSSGCIWALMTAWLCLRAGFVLTVVAVSS